MDWLGHTSASLFPWAIVVIAALAFLALSSKARERIDSLLGRIEKIGISPTGATVELSREQREKLQVAATEVLTNVRTYGNTVNGELQRLAVQGQITDRIRHFVASILKEPFPKGFRSTVYVADPSWDGFLNQLVDYYPGTGDRTAGRRYSVRFGVIGRAWRTEKPYLVGDWLPSGVPRELQQDPARLVEYMAENWGMTIDEARHAARKPSYGAFPIMDGTVIVGLFFMDSDEQNAFGPTPEGGNNPNLKLYNDKLQASDLPSILAALRDKIGPYAVHLDVERLAAL